MKSKKPAEQGNKTTLSTLLVRKITELASEETFTKKTIILKASLSFQSPYFCGNNMSQKALWSRDGTLSFCRRRLLSVAAGIMLLLECESWNFLFRFLFFCTYPPPNFQPDCWNNLSYNSVFFKIEDLLSLAFVCFFFFIVFLIHYLLTFSPKYLSHTHSYSPSLLSTN